MTSKLINRIYLNLHKTREEQKPIDYLKELHEQRKLQPKKSIKEKKTLKQSDKADQPRVSIVVLANRLEEHTQIQKD